MPNDETIEEILLEWQLLRERGSPVSVEQLCQHHPHLVDEVRRRIEALEKMRWLDEDFSISEQIEVEASAEPSRSNPTDNLDELIGRLVGDQLLTRAEIDKQLAEHFRDRVPKATEFAEHLVQWRKITLFQSQALFWNFPKKLLIGDYLLRDRIGSGGMGFVFKALHRPMRRTVALKLLREDVQGIQNCLWRFQREFRSAGRLIHPNIVTAFDAGEVDGMHYLVMEYIKGSNLAEYVSQHGPLSWERAIDYICQAANGLAHAHKHGLIHRDVKPGNLLLANNGVVKILDLGMARPNESHDPNDDSALRDMSSMETVPDANITQVGSVFGTVAYMAPEQRRDIRAADERSDIYSLGCTLYYLITGETIYGELADLVFTFEFAGRKRPSLRRKVPSVPQQVNRIFQKMTSLEPDDRFQSMEEVIQALKPFRPRTALRINPKNVQRALLATLVVILIGFGGFFAWNTYCQQVSHSLCEAVKAADPQTLLRLVPRLQSTRSRVLPELRRHHEADGKDLKRSQSVALALLTLEENVDPLVLKTLLAASNQSLEGVGEFVDSTPELKQRLWDLWNDTTASEQVRLDAACVLANIVGQEDVWSGHGSTLVDVLMKVSEFYVKLRTRQFVPIARHLQEPLQKYFHEGKTSPHRKNAATAMMLLGCEPERWAELVTQADGEQFEILQTYQPSPISKAQSALLRISRTPRIGKEPLDGFYRRRAHAIAALARTGDQQLALSILEQRSDPTLRNWVVRALSEFRQPPSLLSQLIESSPDPFVRQGLLLCLGHYPLDELPEGQRDHLVQTVTGIFEHDPNAVVHAASEWALRQWEVPIPRLTHVKFGVERDWYVNRIGQTMIRFDGPVRFEMGSQEQTDGELRESDESRHQRMIPRSFAIAAHETTAGQFAQFLEDYPQIAAEFSIESLSGQEPPALSWCHAAAFCRWLSEQEQIDESQMCFPEVKQIHPGCVLPQDYLERTGYRMPTEAEWEFVCRATTDFAWGFGESLALASQYAWFSSQTSHPQRVGKKLPNNYGLFDLHGNLGEWCMDVYLEYPRASGAKACSDDRTWPEVTEWQLRVFRGGCYFDNAKDIRTANRSANVPFRLHPGIGLRVARTLTVAKDVQ